jgi:Zn-finger nucleic acid-binding protein
VTHVYRDAPSRPAPPPRCPRDGSELSPQVVESVTLCTCPRCSGVWVDVDELVALLGDRARMDGVALHPVATPARRGGPPAAQVACCRCSKPCERREYGEDSHVEVDVCMVHGLWLDGGELRAVVTYARERARSLTSGNEYVRVSAEELRRRALRGMPRKPARQDATPPPPTDDFDEDLGILEAVLWLLRRIF